MRQLTYHDALIAVMNGSTVILLPKGANPNYLAFGVQKYHPCAVEIPKTDRVTVPSFDGDKVEERPFTHRSLVETYGQCKRAVLEVFSNEEGVSHSAVTAWLVTP